MDHPLFEAKKTASLEAIRELRQLFQRAIQATVTNQALHSKMLLCLSEAANNVVLHGNADQFTISFGRDNIHWWLTLFDDGCPWQPEPHSDPGPLSHFSLDESGRGVALIQAHCDAMEYHAADHHQQQENRLTLKWQMAATSTKPTLLIVEDDPSLRRLYQLYLSEHFHVIEAEGGEQALECVAQEDIALILSDINMPEMNGLGLREQLAKHPESRLIPFVFLTASDDYQTQQHASELGIDDYLLKPVEKAKLVQTIQRVLARNRQITQQLTERIDQRISASLAPKLPEHAHGWQLAVAHRNTGVGGGDFLLHKQTDDQLLLSLNDIMGHDDSAKFFAYAYAGYLRGLMHSIQSNTPQQLLGALSDSAFEDDLLSQITLTCCCASLHKEGQITLASAGHPAPLFITDSGVEAFAVGGMMPGLMPSTDYQPLNVTLQVGERIAFYTDGLFDSAPNESAREQLEKEIKQALYSSRKQPLAQALHHTISLFDQMASTPPKDDSLLLLLEFKP